MTPSITQQARVDARGSVSRRTFLHAGLALGTGLATMGWQQSLLAAAPALRARGKSVILLWMDGGPSQLDSFDPKPGSRNAGTLGVTDTSVPGIQIGAAWPNVAKVMDHLAIVRSVTNKEGNHQRAKYQLHTGYQASGSLKHPSLGAAIAHTIAPEEFDLPSFVSINGASYGSGFLPIAYGPFRVADPSQMPANTGITVSSSRYNRRLGLLDRLQQGYAQAGAATQVEDHLAVYDQASRMVLSRDLAAFDLDEEDRGTRTKYGTSRFGQGCLLARRLVERGVTFVEVTQGGWDTHFDNDEAITRLAGETDPGFGALVADLHERGRLDDTLILWMGEFGRTPRINPRGGRDHFPRAFSVVLGGAGIVGGQVVGATDADGESLVERPVRVPDLFATICSAIGVDPAHENMSPVGRPIALTDGGTPVPELLRTS